MKKMIFRCVILVLLIFSILIITSESRKNNFDIENRCEQTLVSELPSSLPYKIAKASVLEQTHKIPPWWKKIFGYRSPKDGYGQEVKKIVAQEDNIWFAYHNLIQRFNTVTKNKHTYKFTTEGYPIDQVKDILVTQNGGVWAIIKGNTYFMLIYYNSDKNGFSVIPKFENLFPEWNNKEVFNPTFKLHETLDQELIISYQNHLYLYSPQKDMVNELLNQDFKYTINSLAKSDKYLWFTVLETSDLWQLNISTKELKTFNSNLEVFNEPIVIDNFERVWLGYQARFEPEANGTYNWWYPDSLPVEFINLMLWNEDTLSEPDWRYELAPVDNIFIDSTGDLWFSSRAGLIKYDISKDNWCINMSIDIKSAVTEDNKGFLWMVPTETRYWGLYKLQLFSK